MYSFDVNANECKLCIHLCAAVCVYVCVCVRVCMCVCVPGSASQFVVSVHISVALCL